MRETDKLQFVHDYELRSITHLWQSPQNLVCVSFANFLRDVLYPPTVTDIFFMLKVNFKTLLLVLFVSFFLHHTTVRGAGARGRNGRPEASACREVFAP